MTDNDNTLYVTRSKTNAQLLRSAVLNEFQDIRPWVCVLSEADSFRITIDGPWGTRFSETEENKIKEFVKGFKFSNVTAS